MKKAGILFLFSLAAFAQNQTSAPSASPTPPTPPVKDFTVQCLAFPTATQACNSYNEMIAAKDADVVGTMSHNNSYVCFRSNEDVFLIFSIGDPYSLTFKKQQNGILQAPGWVILKRFKSGQIDELQIGTGTWETLSEQTSPSFSTAPKADPNIYINDSQISLSHEFKNLGGGTTNYSLQIRRSTLRATESMAWDNPPKDPKSPPNRGTTDYEGRCTSFLN